MNYLCKDVFGRLVTSNVFEESVLGKDIQI